MHSEYEYKQARTQDFAQEGATCSRRGPQVTRGPPWRLGALGDQGPQCDQAPDYQGACFLRSICIEYII